MNKQEENQMLDEHLARKAMERFKDQPNSESWKIIVILSMILSIVGSVGSGLTMIAAGFYFLLTIPLIARILIVVVFVVTYECLKSHLLSQSFKSFWKTRKVGKTLLLTTSFLVTLSAGISGLGGRYLSKVFLPENAISVKYEEKEAAIRRMYRDEVDKLAEERNAFRKSSVWKGRQSSKDRQKTEAFNSQIREAKAAERVELLKLEKQEKKAYLGASEERKTLQWIFISVAVFFDLLILSAETFIWWYWKEVLNEIPREGKEPQVVDNGTYTRPTYKMGNEGGRAPRSIQQIGFNLEQSTIDMEEKKISKQDLCLFFGVKRFRDLKKELFTDEIIQDILGIEPTIFRKRQVFTLEESQKIKLYLKDKGLYPSPFS